LDNSKILQTAEEHESFRDIKFYENAIEETKLDLLKCNPSDTEFIEALTRAQDSCTMAYQAACNKLHKLLIEGDQREARQQSLGYVHSTRHKTVEHRRNNPMTKTMAKSPQKDNNIFKPRESPHQTPTTNRSDKKPRPTAWLTAQQIRAQNPYRKLSDKRSPTCMKRSPPWHKESIDQS
jgi:hypothetical protein